MTSTTKGLRYLASKDKFLRYAFLSIGEQFSNCNELICFLNSIKTDVNKNLFLKTASFYLFLVKCGCWTVNIAESDEQIEYITNTYKYISIFSLIESLLDKRDIDFYQFLVRKKSGVVFPISDQATLDSHYEEYKSEFGSVSHCISFFQLLSHKRQQDLISKLEISGTKPSIENYAKFLYDLRSKFLHQCELIHDMANGTSVTPGCRSRSKRVICKLSISDTQTFFEEGLIAYFKTKQIP